LWAVADHPLHVSVRHVAEHPAHEHQVSRDQVRVLAGQRGVAEDDLEPVQASPGRQAPGHPGVARIQFHQARGHVVAARVAGQRDDQVRALPGAQADRAQRAWRRLIERGADAVLDPGQPP